jgi:hypothetical protein
MLSTGKFGITKNHERFLESGFELKNLLTAKCIKFSGLKRFVKFGPDSKYMVF